jgi:hypothetical protein
MTGLRACFLKWTYRPVMPDSHSHDWSFGRSQTIPPCLLAAPSIPPACHLEDSRTSPTPLTRPRSLTPSLPSFAKTVCERLEGRTVDQTPLFPPADGDRASTRASTCCVYSQTSLASRAARAPSSERTPPRSRSYGQTPRCAGPSRPRPARHLPRAM